MGGSGSGDNVPKRNNRSFSQEHKARRTQYLEEQKQKQLQTENNIEQGMGWLKDITTNNEGTNRRNSKERQERRDRWAREQKERDDEEDSMYMLGMGSGYKVTDSTTPPNRAYQSDRSGTNDESPERRKFNKKKEEATREIASWNQTPEEADQFGKRMEQAIKHATDTEQCGERIDKEICDIQESFTNRKEELQQRAEREMELLEQQEEEQLNERREAKREVVERGKECIELLEGLTKGNGKKPLLVNVKLRPLPPARPLPITPRPTPLQINQRTIQHSRDANRSPKPTPRTTAKPTPKKPQAGEQQAGIATTSATAIVGNAKINLTDKEDSETGEEQSTSYSSLLDSDPNATPTKERIASKWPGGPPEARRAPETARRTPDHGRVWRRTKDPRKQRRSPRNTPLARRRERRSTSYQEDTEGDDAFATPEKCMRRVRGLERERTQLTQMLAILTGLQQRQQNERDEPYKKKKRDCPTPEKFQGVEGESCDTWLELFHEWTQTQNLTPKAEVAALLKNVGKIPARVLSNLPQDERWDPEANYRALRERWSHENARAVNRQDFNVRKQKEGESLEEYMDELCRIRRSGWKTEQGDSFEEAVKLTFWGGIRNEAVLDQMWNILQLQELQDISLKEVLANAKRAKYVAEQKGLRQKPNQSRQAQAPYEPRQDRNPNTFRPNRGKCYGCGGSHLVADCRDPYLLKNSNNVKAILETGTTEEELWAVAQRAAEMDYRAEEIARCFDNGGLYALERKPGSCFRCGEPGHKANECQNRGRNNNNGNTVTCGSCGTPGHSSQDCMKRGNNNPRPPVVCYACGEVGHYANDCRSERSGKPAAMGDRPEHLRPQNQRHADLSMADLEARMTRTEQKTDKIFNCLEVLCQQNAEGRMLMGASANANAEPLRILQREATQQTSGNVGPSELQKN